MAIGTASVFEIRTGGNDINGGGFVTGATGTDYSQQNSKNTAGADISTTDAVGAGSTTLTSVTANWGTTIVGNIIYLQGGTGTLAAGWYQVTARASTTSITLDRTVAVGTGITMNIGGALASLGGVFVTGVGLTNQHTVYVKSGTYSITSATNNISGGTCNASISPSIIGYNTNRNLTNTDTMPLIQFGVTAVSLFLTRGLVYNLAMDGNAQTVAKASAANDQTVFSRCTFTNMNSASGGGTYFFCTATANSAGIWGGSAYYCEAYANTATPNVQGATDYFNCIHYNNTGATTDGFTLAGTPSQAVNCIAYGNGRAGFNFGSTSRSSMTVNCHAENNTTYGFDFSGTSGAQIIYNCSAYNNTTARYPTANAASQQIVGFVTVTAGSVFVAAGSNNFALNNTASQGALLRAAGFPALFLRGTTASYPDIGAAQHQDSGSGSSYTGFFLQ